MSQFYNSSGGGGGTGDVIGPGSSTDNAIARWDGITGTLLANSVPTIDDTGNIQTTASAGSGLSIGITNTAAAGNAHASLNLTTNSSSSGDPRILFSDGSTNWTVGFDQSASSNPFTVSRDNILGSQNHMSLTGSMNTFGEANIQLARSNNGDAYIECLNTAGGASASTSFRAENGASGLDCYSLYTITGTTTWATGVDNSDSDAYKITTGATPSAGTTAISIATTGQVTIPNLAPASTVATVPIGAVTAQAGAYNLGISYNAGTGVFTVTSVSGTALSATNPGYIVMPSKANPGRLLTFTLTADQNFIDDNGASEIIGNLFGLTTGVAYAEDIPFYIYAVVNDAASLVQIGISRIPHLTSSPASANMGCPGTANADVQYSIFLFDSVTLTEYDSNPCICIGSFRMRMSASDDWTVQTLDNADGIGQYQEGRNFTFPLAVFGAATSTYFLDNGGTAPVFSTNNYTYSVTRSGLVFMNVFASGDGGTDGAGSVQAQLSVPYNPIGVGVTAQNLNLIQYTYAGGGGGGGLGNTYSTSTLSNAVRMSQTDGSSLDNDLFASGGRSVVGSLNYKIAVS